ncbi:MAG: LamG-like jellyroll fold domain-containing protein [Nannocystales bacterium]
MRRAGLILGGLALAGCPSLGAYQCERDGDCNREGLAGRCLDDAACAYPENAGRCESGWARSPNAAESPGACIDAEPPATTGTTSATPTGTSSTTSDSASSSPMGSESGSGGTNPCDSAEVVIDTGTFSPAAGLSDYVLWLPLDAWPEGRERLASGGVGLRITDTSGAVLSFERADQFDDTPALWLKLPTFAASDTLTLTFTFVPDLEDPDPTAVWSPNYLGVWHLDDAPMGLEGDITSNAATPEEPGVLLGTMTPEQHVQGQLGSATAFDGDDDIIEIAASFQGQLSAYSFSAWARVDSDDPASRGSFFQRLNGDFYYPRCWHNSDSGETLFCQEAVDGETSGASSGKALPIGEFFYLSLVRDPEAAETTVYFNGDARGTMTSLAGGTLDSDEPPLPFELGHGEWGTLTGLMDEVRVSEAVHSPQRVRADYRSQAGALQVAEFGLLEPASCPD